MNNQSVIFDERQYLGTNKQTMSLRIFLALFCFVAYFYTDSPESNGELLFILGVAILVISVVLLFVTHIHLTVDKNSIQITGILNSSKVEIPLKSIVSAEKIVYSKYIINNPVYNLHRNGTIKFYSGGKDAVKLTCSDGLVYIIGTHKPVEFMHSLSLPASREN